MKNKWFFSAFVIILAFIGISLEQSTMPNQEIIIRFSDAQTSLDQTQEAITHVRSQLESIDVDNIKIEEVVNGTLKITYYSTIEVSEIRQLFTTSKNVALNKNTISSYISEEGLPIESEEERYELRIFKIQDSNDLGGTAGTLVIEPKSESTRASSIKTYATYNKQQLEEKNNIKKLVCTDYGQFLLFRDNTSFNIPEVRAGPSA